jgi:hypothetical protein
MFAGGFPGWTVEGVEDSASADFVIDRVTGAISDESVWVMVTARMAELCKS